MEFLGSHERIDSICRFSHASSSRYDSYPGPGASVCRMHLGNYTRIGETTVFYISKQDGRMDVTQPRVTGEGAVEGLQGLVDGYAYRWRSGEGSRVRASERGNRRGEPASRRTRNGEAAEAEGTRSKAKERGLTLGRRRPALQGRSPLLLARAWATVFAVAVLLYCRVAEPATNPPDQPGK